MGRPSSALVRAGKCEGSGSGKEKKVWREIEGRARTREGLGRQAAHVPPYACARSFVGRDANGGACGGAGQLSPDCREVLQQVGHATAGEIGAALVKVLE